MLIQVFTFCLSLETWRLDNDESKITLLKVTKNQEAGLQNGRIIEFNLSVLSFKSFQPAMLYWMEAVPVTSSHAQKRSDRHEDVQMGMRPHAKRPCEKR